MSYSVKLNGDSLDSTKIDIKLINKMQLSTDSDLFIAKASFCKMIYHDCNQDDISFLSDKINCFTIYKGLNIEWLGYVKMESIKYEKRKKQYSFICYDMMKLLPEIAIDLTTIEDTSTKVSTILNNIISNLTSYINNYHCPTLSPLIDETEILPNIPYLILKGSDVNSNQYEIKNIAVGSGALGIRLSNVNFMINTDCLFCEDAETGGYDDCYVGFLKGYEATYFSNSSGVRIVLNDFASNGAEVYYCEKVGEISLYYQHYDNGNKTLIGYRFDSNGAYLGGFSFLVSSWDYHLEYVSGTLTLVAGTSNHYMSSTYEVNDDKLYIVEDREYPALCAKIKDNLGNQPYPYKYSEPIKASDILKELAIYFGGFFSLYNNVLRFTTILGTDYTFDDFDKKIEDDTKWGKAIIPTIALDNNIHAYIEIYINYLTTFYGNNYDNYSRIRTIQFYSALDIDLYSTIDMNRIIELNKAIIKENYYRYTIKTLNIN